MTWLGGWNAETIRAEGLEACTGKSLPQLRIELQTYLQATLVAAREGPKKMTAGAQGEGGAVSLPATYEGGKQNALPRKRNLCLPLPCTKTI